MKTTQSRVIKQEDKVPRQSWKLSTVKRLIHGRDNLVHAAVVQMVSERRRTEIKRPVQKLYPVEVSNDHRD